jgi:hypothetical protein
MKKNLTRDELISTFAYIYFKTFLNLLKHYQKKWVLQPKQTNYDRF